MLTRHMSETLKRQKKPRLNSEYLTLELKIYNIFSYYLLTVKFEYNLLMKAKHKSVNHNKDKASDSGLFKMNDIRNVDIDIDLKG